MAAHLFWTRQVPQALLGCILSLLMLCPCRAGLAVSDALRYLEKHSTRHQQELIELASIPSVSAIPEYSDSCLKAAKWLQKRLKAAGMENAQILPTEAKTHQPVVYADWLHAKGQPTVLIYGHYDVQPAEDTDLWHEPPFNAYLKDGYFYGRGVDDDKGGLLPAIQVMEAYLKTSGALPVNVKFLLEGQEEIGSPNLPSFLSSQKKLLQSDFALSADGGQESAEQGILVLGLRGASAFQVELRTLNRDVHSGTFGGTIQNANHALAAFISGLHFSNGSVSIPHFYDKVRDITEENKRDLANFLLFDEAENLRKIGATEVFGEEGFSTLERTWHRPTCDVVGQWGGFTGQGVKTIVPGKAFAKIACRLVPDQDPHEILQLAKQYVESLQIPGAHLKYESLHWAAPPYSMAKESLPNRAAAKVLKEMFGKPPLFYRMGGSIPAAAYMQTHLGITTTMFGFGMPSNNIHAPNERYGLDEFQRAHRGYAKILHEIAAATAAETSSRPPESQKHEEF